MRHFTFFCLLSIVSALSQSQAAPVPKCTIAKPAVIDAGTEKNIDGVGWYLVNFARVAVRENEKIAGLPIIRRQKDWEAWLKKNLRVERVKDTNLVRVSFQDGNAKQQAAIINVVVDYYLKNDIDSSHGHAEKAIKSVKDGVSHLRKTGRLTPEYAAKAEKAINKHEEYIRTLPALVEHAIAP